MTTKELRKRVSFSPSGYGHYKVRIYFRGKEYHSTTSNMMAIDRARDDEGTMVRDAFYPTPKQALLSLWDEVKRKNNLN